MCCQMNPHTRYWSNDHLLCFFACSSHLSQPPASGTANLPPLLKHLRLHRLPLLYLQLSHISHLKDWSLGLTHFFVPPLSLSLLAFLLQHVKVSQRISQLQLKSGPWSSPDSAAIPPPSQRIPTWPCSVFSHIIPLHHYPCIYVVSSRFLVFIQHIGVAAIQLS